jgi:hypothetical protein
MFQRLREYLALILIILLPFHALAVTVLTKVIAGPGHAPLAALAVWKEGLLAIILLLAVAEMLIVGKKWWKIDLIDGLILALIALGFVISLLLTPYSSLLILGFKYDFLPLVAFIILRRVQWTEWFMERVVTEILWVGGVVAAYGILTLFLPDTFFYWLGYSDLHSLYLPGKPIAAFQQIGGSSLHRIQSTMSGPNQLGVWLLIPLGVGMVKMKAKKLLVIGYWLLVCAAMLLTFSRAAWIGAAMMIGIAMWPVLRSLSRRVAISLVTFAICFLVLIVMLFPSIILRAASTRGHIENPMKAVLLMMEHPFGMGLGTAGPASNRTSDTCVFVEPGTDYSWAYSHQDLCVFMGTKQMQPLGRACSCPFLPENWYLQIGVELGWIGFVLYLMLVGGVMYRLYELKMENGKLRIKLSIFNYQLYILTAVSVAALFLHAWEDGATAYTVWVLISSTLAVAAKR